MDTNEKIVADQKLLLLRSLREVIPGYRTEFQGPQASELAVALIAKQNERWSAIFSWIESNSPYSFYIDVLRQVQERSSPPSTFNNGSSVTIDGQFPLIAKPLNDEFSSLARRYPGISLAYILTKCSGAIPPRPSNEIAASLFTLDASELRVLAELADNDAQKNRVTDALNEVAELQARTATTENTISQLEIHAATLLQTLEGNDKKRRDDWEIEKKNIIEALKREAAEAARIEASIDLWDDKARSHTKGFRIGLAIFCLLLSATIIGVVWLGIGFIKEIADKFKDSEQYFGIALLLIPTLAAAWIIRVVVKVTLQNLLLAQDARQRHTQIQTYLRMLGDASHPISDKERILALSAIFRPLAGQGTDEVNPPTVAELLREALEGSPKAKP